jgi:hypothetical protein
MTTILAVGATVVEDLWVSVGSANFGNGSFRLNGCRADA